MAPRSRRATRQRTVSIFGAQVYPSERVGSYPQVRGVTLTAIPTYLIRNATFGPYDVNEMLYAKELLAFIPDDSLTAFDKGFLSAKILCTLISAGSNRHFVIPAKANARWEIVKGTAEDGVVAMRVSPQARKKCPNLPESWRVRAITVIDQSAQACAPDLPIRPPMLQASDITQCYARRWHDELSGTQAEHAGHGADLAQQND